jgi:hypothetical protein
MNHKIFILAVMLFSMSICGFAKLEKSVRATVQEEVQHHPKLEIQDLYKFAYQAAMGNEHIMVDTAMVRSYLIEEWRTIDTSSLQPLADYLSNDSSIVRINLQSYKQRGGNIEKLVAAMIQTAKSIQPSVPLLKIYLSQIIALADDAIIPFTVEDVRHHFQEMEAKNFPAVHHSKRYEEFYHPAYRVVAGILVKELAQGSFQ